MERSDRRIEPIPLFGGRTCTSFCFSLLVSVKVTAGLHCAIDKILALPEDDLLSALSEHLGEMSSNGSDLIRLNRWESIVYYADELWTEVNSGGFGGYLYYYGIHFEKEDERFYSVGEKELHRCLLSFVKVNQKHFH